MRSLGAADSNHELKNANPEEAGGMIWICLAVVR
jgi:hypothetical protein